LTNYSPNSSFGQRNRNGQNLVVNGQDLIRKRNEAEARNLLQNALNVQNPFANNQQLPVQNATIPTNGIQKSNFLPYQQTQSKNVF
jgi:hypothetical protein